MPIVAPNITALVEDFVSQVMAATEAAAAARAQAAVAAVFGIPTKRGPGRPPRSLLSAATPTPARPALRRKAPKATAKLIRARKLQGQYLGALKSLGGADKAKVKAVAKQKGVPEALKLAASLKAKK